MNKAVKLVGQFHQTIDQWIDWLNDYTLDQLCASPQKNSWSLGQVYTHIINDTRYFVEQMKASLLIDAGSENDMHEQAKHIFRNNQFPDVKIDGPATGKFIPQPKSKQALRKGLLSIRDEVDAIYKNFEHSQLKGKTRHPGLLYFNSLEWLQFAEMHMRHHFRQKKRIDEKLFLHKP